MVTVLVVEDDPDLQKLLSKVFAFKGFEARLASSLASACIALDSGEIDVVLTDMNLALASEGLDVIRYARERSIPVAVMSASVQSNDPMLIGMGAAVVLPKPFDVMTLPDVVGGLVA